MLLLSEKGDASVRPNPQEDHMNEYTTTETSAPTNVLELLLQQPPVHLHGQRGHRTAPTATVSGRCSRMASGAIAYLTRVGIMLVPDGQGKGVATALLDEGVQAQLRRTASTAALLKPAASAKALTRLFGKDAGEWTARPVPSERSKVLFELEGRAMFTLELRDGRSHARLTAYGDALTRGYGLLGAVACGADGIDAVRLGECTLTAAGRMGFRWLPSTRMLGRSGWELDEWQASATALTLRREDLRRINEL